MPIKLCSDPTPPLYDCAVTTIYGAPRKHPGRVPPVVEPQVETPISGIAVHCLSDTYQAYLSKVCKASASLMPCGHASMHYVIDGDTGQVSSLVKESDVAWAFQSYLSNFPLPHPQEPYPGWSVLNALFPLLSADFYTINIGITSPTRTGDFLDDELCCLGPYGATDKAYQVLIRLVAWIADRYNIPRDTQHIAFHDDIVLTIEGCQECICSDLTCFICDVTGYCESCNNVGDPSFVLGTEIFYVYGETENGCKVKVLLSDLLGA
jgi:hypothetical protein